MMLSVRAVSAFLALFCVAAPLLHTACVEVEKGLSPQEGLSDEQPALSDGKEGGVEADNPGSPSPTTPGDSEEEPDEEEQQEPAEGDDEEEDVLLSPEGVLGGENDNGEAEVDGSASTFSSEGFLANRASQVQSPPEAEGTPTTEEDVKEEGLDLTAATETEPAQQQQQQQPVAEEEEAAAAEEPAAAPEEEPAEAAAPKEEAEDAPKKETDAAAAAAAPSTGFLGRIKRSLSSGLGAIKAKFSKGPEAGGADA